MKAGLAEKEKVADDVTLTSADCLSELLIAQPADHQPQALGKRAFILYLKIFMDQFSFRILTSS